MDGGKCDACGWLRLRAFLTTNRDGWRKGDRAFLTTNRGGWGESDRIGVPSPAVGLRS
jgi:hypothetical protein